MGFGPSPGGKSHNIVRLSRLSSWKHQQFINYSSGFPTPALVNVVSLCSCKSCWPETQRLPDISAENMGLFRIRRVLQYRVWNHVQVPYTTRERELFYREKKKVGGAIIKNPWLSLVGSLPGKKNLSFFLLPSSFFFIQALLSSPLNSGQSLSCVRLFASPTVFNWGFCLLTFYNHGIQYSPIFSILGQRFALCSSLSYESPKSCWFFQSIKHFTCLLGWSSEFQYPFIEN